MCRHSWEKINALCTVDDGSTELAKSLGTPLMDGKTQLTFVRIGRRCTKCRKEIHYPAFDYY